MEADPLLQEFADVEPIYEKDVPNGICKVSYYGDFEQRLAILKGCIKNGELSDRVFKLTGSIIRTNTPYITAWVIRQKCILKNGVNWDEEFEFLDEIRGYNEKCYQTWMHRHFLVQLSGNYSREKDYCDSYIALDNKNIHAWTHRQWIIQTFDQWDGEMEYTAKYIDIDIFNNSAWSHRFFIARHCIRDNVALSNEIEFTLGKIHLAPHNEAAWNYLIGLMKQFKDYCYDDVVYEVKTLLKTVNDIPSAYFLLIQAARSTFEKKELETAISYCDQLQVIDSIRTL
ncbi:hypothetical protein WA556_006642 [Blastocystis sp. ATCC 50177/Nand II]